MEYAATLKDQDNPSKYEKSMVFVLLDTAAEIESMFKDGWSSSEDDTADKQIKRLLDRVNKYLWKAPKEIHQELAEAKQAVVGKTEIIKCVGPKTDLVNALTAEYPWLPFDLDK